jgi:UDP-N-acetyl-D-mannosaminuronic acid dehydrogenase
VQVCVVGLGRVGLPAAARSAAAGHSVTAVDRDQAAVARATGPHPTEPGLAELIDAGRASGRLRFAVAPVPAEVYVVCVGTPLRPGTHEADLADLTAAVQDVAGQCPADALVLIESTVPVGTTERLAHLLRAGRPGVRVAAAPERILPGNVLVELAREPRVVGGVDPASADAAAVYLESCGSGRVERTDSRTAELCKLVENAARDVEIALANTVAAVARRAGVDPYALRALVNQHPRVKLRVPGIGVGGHCLPVDPWFLIGACPEETGLLATAREVNDGAVERWVAAIRRVAEGREVGLLGLGYKPDSDDLRLSPAVAIAVALSAEGPVVVADPYHERIGGLQVVSAARALSAPVVVLLVAHRAYRDLRSRLRPDQVAIDACGGWS